MSEFWVRREGSTLHPIDTESCDALEKLPREKLLHVEVKLPRNAAHSRLYWALCQRIGNALGIDSENISDILKISTGHCKFVRSKRYGVVRIPKSISFAAMDQTAFSEFFERCVLCISEEWGMARKDILAAVEDLLVPTERLRA